MRHFAVIGNPIDHSLSPAIHHANFNALGLDWRYDKILVDDISKIREIISDNHLDGVNVTLPYKLDVIKQLDEVCLPNGCNAVNTIKVVGSRLIGYNTDIAGFHDDLAEHHIRLDGHEVLLLGYGGLGQTLAKNMHIMLENGHDFKLTVANRSEKDGVDIVVNSQEMINLLPKYDIVIDTTKIGSLDAPGLSLEAAKAFTGCFYECTPGYSRITEYLNLRSYGYAIDGSGMLVFQGARSFEIWNDGMKADVNAMKQCIKRNLEKR